MGYVVWKMHLHPLPHIDNLSKFAQAMTATLIERTI
jgi:hypothetical protein